MKKMNEVLNIRVVKNAFYDASNDSWICAFVDEEKAQHAAHAINHVDALADALGALLKELDLTYVHSSNLSDAIESADMALAAYRGGK